LRKTGRKPARKSKARTAIRSRVPMQLDNNINLLLDLQARKGYLPKKELMAACREKGIPGVDVYGVATFYAQFRLIKQGKYILSLCSGTACHVKGAEKLQAYIHDLLGIRPGETTKDGRFTLRTVNCVGACSKAPNLMVDDVVYGELDKPKVRKLIEGLK